MNARALALIEKQNQLLQEQNELLRGLQTAQQGTSALPAPARADRMMTDYDLILIVSSDDVLAAVDRWNKSVQAK